MGNRCCNSQTYRPAVRAALTSLLSTGPDPGVLSRAPAFGQADLIHRWLVPSTYPPSLTAEAWCGLRPVLQYLGGVREDPEGGDCGEVGICHGGAEVGQINPEFHVKEKILQIYFEGNIHN